MFSTTSISVRLKKECDAFISKYFTNKQTFMRNAIEAYCESSFIRITQPQGGACINFYTGGYGMVQYYWNYYKGQQFIVVTNESGIQFQSFPELYREKIYELLKIRDNEIVDFYVPVHAVVVNPDNCKGLDHSRVIWRQDKFALWNFENKAFTRKVDEIPNEEIIKMMKHMNMHNSHYLLNRDAFIYEQLYNATAEWEPFPSIKCTRIIGV